MGVSEDLAFGIQMSRKHCLPTFCSSTTDIKHFKTTTTFEFRIKDMFQILQYLKSVQGCLQICHKLKNEEWQLAVRFGSM